MASIYEDLAIFLFERGLNHPLTIHRRGMKKAMLRAMAGGPEQPPDEHYVAISGMRRTPDAMAHLPARFAPHLGLPGVDTILAVEAEHSSPIPVPTLMEYADIWQTFDAVSEHWNFAVVVVGHYGEYRLLDLPGIAFWRCTPRAAAHRAAADRKNTVR